MSYIARLIDGPSDGQTFILESETVEFIDNSEPETDTTVYYEYIGDDPKTGEHLFRWNKDLAP